MVPILFKRYSENFGTNTIAACAIFITKYTYNIFGEFKG